MVSPRFLAVFDLILCKFAVNCGIHKSLDAIEIQPVLTTERGVTLGCLKIDALQRYLGCYLSDLFEICRFPGHTLYLGLRISARSDHRLLS